MQQVLRHQILLNRQIGKVETTPVDISELINVVKTDLVKKTEYNELVRKI